MSSKRILKINSDIKKAISNIILYDLNNPEINGLISVVKVNTTTDLDVSKIYLSIFNSDDKEKVFEQIKKSTPFIRKQLGSKVILRKVPNLEFYLDRSDMHLENIEKLIAETKKG